MAAVPVIDEAMIAEITAKIVKNFDPDMVVLFGSLASGSSCEDSDIDLLVVMETDAPPRGTGVTRQGE